jgi:phage terminase large subunit
MPRIKLPNNWQPRAYQLPAWNYLENGGRHAELIWHRRSGKDEVAMHRTACAAFERIAGYWHMLPEYSQARKAIWDAVNPHTGKRRIDEAFPLELRKSTRNQEMMIEFVNGSSWQVVGSDNYNSLVGSAPAGIVYSEWALANPNARAYLRPILAENNGWQMFVTTSRGRNHAHTTLKAAEKIMRAGGDAFAQVLDATQTGVFTQQRLEEELQSYIDEFGEDYGRAKFEQEYLCSFDAANIGAILARAISQAERSGRVSDEVEFDPYGQPLDITADIGRRDTATWWFWQRKIGGYSVFDYDGGWGIDAEEWCDRLHKRIGQYKLADGRSALGVIWLPHDARAKTFAAKRSAVEIFLEKFGEAHVRITPNSSKADRINAARVLMPRIEFNATKAERGLDGLRAWSYEYDEEKKIFSSEPRHDWASHDGDGFSYGALIMQQDEPPPPPMEQMRGITVGANTATLDELWASVPAPTRQRI